MKVNKFNIHWQIVRADAKSIKKVDEKIKFIINFLNSNKNIHNYERVLNWLKMTSLSYENNNRVIFNNCIHNIENNYNEYQSCVDNVNNLEDISTNDLLKVFKDLSKRKYNFQFKSVPKDHTNFMDNLNNEIAKRKI